jgi:hypothetical protein
VYQPRTALCPKTRCSRCDRHLSGSCRSRSSHEGDGPAPTAASVLYLDRQARHLEAERIRFPIQVRQLLDLAVLALYPCEVRLPEQLPVPRFAELPRGRLEDAVEAVGVDPDIFDPLVAESEHRSAGEPRLQEVLRAAQVLVATCHEHHDVQRV